MSARVPRALVAALGIVTVVALAALAVFAYRDRPAAGLRLAGIRTVSARARGARTVVDRPCQALPRAIRRGAVPLAFLQHGALRTIDLHSCLQRTLLASGVQPPIRVSADGRWVGSGGGLISSRNGGKTERPLGGGIWRVPTRATWGWAPRGDALAGITTDGAVMLGHPGGRPRTLEPDGWGATSIAFDGVRQVAVVRGSRQLWTIALHAGVARRVAVAPGAGTVLQIAAVRNGSVIAWRQPFQSASVQADGDALIRIDLRTGRISRLAGAVIVAPGFVTACGPGLAVLSGFGRDTTGGKRIVVFDRHWRRRVVGVGVSPSCSADGRTIAYGSGRREPSLRFGDERRTIKVVRLGGRARTLASTPRRGSGADAPVLSADGRVVEWAATNAERIPRDGPAIVGALHAALTTPPLHRTGPLAALGSASDYYGTLSWSQTLAAIPAP